MNALDDRTRPSTLDIHRLLDEAFAGVEMTPEVQDLKEEMRADLVVRVAEWESSGIPAAEAARRAIATLGDVRSVVDEMPPASRPGSPWHTQRVRPKPAFVVRTVLLAVVAAGALAVVGFGAIGDRIALAAVCGAAVVLAIVAGALVTDGLRQETTGNYPLPGGRALAYGAAASLAVVGLSAAAMYLRDRDLPWLIGGALAVLGAAVMFTYLGVTQTNRHKPWMVQLQNSHEEAADRFTRDPAAAARFGVYTVAIMIVTVAAFAGLSLAVGFTWSWLALVGGLVVFLITLARMLFGAEHTH